MVIMTHADAATWSIATTVMTHRDCQSLDPFSAWLALCCGYPVVCLGLRAFLVQRPAAEEDAADDRACGEDAGGPPERGVVAVCQRQPGESLVPNALGCSEMCGEVGGDGGGEDGVQQR